MADGGGWVGGAGLGLNGPGDDGARLARERFLDVLTEFGERLNSPLPMRREAAVATVQQLDRLARRMAVDHADAHSRAEELDLALGALAARLDAEAAGHTVREAELTRQVNKLKAELAEVRASKRPLLDAVAARTILAAVAACAALGGAGWGVMKFTRPPAPETAEVLPVEVAPEPATEEAAPGPVELSTPMETLPPAVAPVAAPIALAIPVVPQKPVARESYAAVAAGLSRGDATAIARLTGLAQGGDAKAQLHLARLYESGAAGLSRDMAAARLWTRKAAEGGDRAAMYNLGLFMMDGDGGAQDLRGAAGWFRRAADRGVVDAQYNLGLMYEVGRGVERSPREALRWFASAAKAGDPAARQKRGELERQLKAPEPPTVIAKAEAPQVEPEPDAGVPGASVTETQTYLAQMGYYIGPIDGVVSPALKAAAEAYMQDRPIARTH